MGRCTAKRWTEVPHRPLTRAFTGRRPRGIANRFLVEHSADAPAAYPDVHHITAPLRARAATAATPTC